MFRLRSAAITIAVLILAPLGMLGWVAVQGSGALWGHLARYVLPDAALQTFLLLGGVALVAGSIGTCCAWLVTMRDFPLRRLLDWALLLPMAVPTYIVAFAYLDVLHPVGPIQAAVRGLFGIADPRHSLLPDPRSLPGCALLMGLVLYPYVYLNLRAAFLAQSEEFLAVGRSLGGSEWQLFRHVTLPLARPALAVGLGLALLEALNDIGAAEYLGVQTLSVAIATTWVTRSSAAGAAQIALALLLVAALLVWLEQLGRQRAGSLAVEEFGTAAQPQRLGSWGQGLAVIACSLPVLLGFGVPAGYLAHAAGQRVAEFGLPP